MRYLFLTGGIGLALLFVLIDHYGFGEVTEAFASVGWGILLLLACRIVQVSLAGLAWRRLFPKGRRVSSATAIRLRFVREGINTLLPVAQVGGELIGARLLAHAGLGASAATATVIVDMFTQAFTQALFTFLGLGILILYGGDSMIVREVAVGLMLLVPGLIGFFLVQRLGGFGWVERKLVELARSRKWDGFERLNNLDEYIQGIYRNRRALLLNCLIHLSVWIIGSLEVWVVLAFSGQQVSFAEALVIESLMQAVRSASFVVPAGLGVQEGGLIALCAVFGVPAPVALALSLTKRVAELTVGSCGILLWQLAESRLAIRRTHRLQVETVDG